MTTTGENDELLPKKPTRRCISCFKEYDRKQTNLFKPLQHLPQFYFLCMECLDKDKNGCSSIGEAGGATRRTQTITLPILAEAIWPPMESRRKSPRSSTF